MDLIQSIIIYSLVFIVATCFFYFSTISNKKSIGIVFAVLGILVLSIFAASRSDNIGKDVKGYVVPLFDIAKSSTSFNDFLNLGHLYSSADSTGKKEMSYLILTFLSSRISNNDSTLLFIIQFLTVTPVYLSAVNFSKKYKLSIPFYMLCYMLLFYLNSFNVMRQSMSCAFFLLGFSYGKNNKWKMISSYVIAVLLHRMAFLGIIFLCLGMLLSKLRGYKKIILLISVGVMLVFLKPIITILMEYNLLTPAQSYYVDVFVFGTIATTWTNIAGGLLILDGVRRTLLLLPYFSIKRSEGYMYELKNAVLVGYIAYMVLLVTTQSVYGSRISMFTDFLYIPLLSYFEKKKLNNSVSGYLIITLILIVFCIIWDLIVNGYRVFEFRF